MWCVMSADQSIDTFINNEKKSTGTTTCLSSVLCLSVCLFVSVSVSGTIFTVRLIYTDCRHFHT